MSHAAAGYLHESYARSLSEQGRVRELPLCGGWILERPIDDSGSVDGMGCYPLFSCMDWSKLPEDLDRLNGNLVSICLVTDPFGDYEERWLRSSFRDLVLPFKQHYLVELSAAPESFVSRHHLRNARKAWRDISVRTIVGPEASLDDWVGLYDILMRRHHISGLRAFPRSSFEAQLRVPGAQVLEARAGDEVVGMLLWYLYENRAYYHLGAFSERGYELRASFALFDYAIRYFSDKGLGWLSLGAGAGVRSTADDGLDRFKAGWANSSRQVYFCGRIFDRARYDAIVARQGGGGTDYFPAYRTGEFA